jgi:hypothetical protein
MEPGKCEKFDKNHAHRKIMGIQIAMPQTVSVQTKVKV